MSLNHPNAKSAYIVHEGHSRGPRHMVLEIKTDLHTNPQHPQFDFQKLTALIEAGMSYVAQHNRQVDDFRIVPLNDEI
jgi:hypothetical protein